MDEKESEKNIMDAIQSGEVHTIKELMDQNYSVDFEYSGETPADRAFERKQYEILLLLLKANSKFPRKFNVQFLPENLLKFYEHCKNVHESIKNGNLQQLKTFLNEYSNLKYIFDTQNNSAMKTAIVFKKFEIYEFLYKQNLFLSPHEDFNEIVESLSDKDRMKLRDLNAKLSASVFPEEMTILMRNCSYGCGNENQKLYQEFVHGAFQFLFSIPQIATYLKVVAARRKFTITFDFQRDSVQFLDPSSESSVNGLFYLNGRIYIAASDITNPEKKYQIYSVMAHELCHSAMSLTYENNANPYFKHEKSKINELKCISKLCHNQRRKEALINLVYDCYDKEMYHAELIVRPPQMMVLYHEDQATLKEKQETFLPLFEYFNSKCLTDMERKLPEIQSKYCPKRRIKRMKGQICCLATTALSAFLIAILLLKLYIFAPNYSWKSLKEDQKITFKNSTITYFDVAHKFSDLFADDSDIFNHLSSTHIEDTLNGDSMELSQEIVNIYHHFLFLNWMNMTKSLQDKILNCDFNLQGKNIKIGKVLSINSKALEFLSSSEIKSILCGKGLKVLNSIDFAVDSVVPRDFKEFNKSSDRRNFDDVINKIESEKLFLISAEAGEGKSVAMQVFWIKLKERFSNKLIFNIALKKHQKAFEKVNSLSLRDAKEIKYILMKDILALEKRFDSALYDELFDRGDIIFLWDGFDELLTTRDFFLKLMKVLKSQSKILQFVATRSSYGFILKTSLKVKSFDFYPLSEVDKFKFLVRFVADKVENNLDDFDGKLNHDLKVILNQNYSDITKLKTDIANISNVISEKLEESKIILDNVETVMETSTVSPLLLKMIVQITSTFKIEHNATNLFSIYDFFVRDRIKTVNGQSVSISDQDIMEDHQVKALKLLIDKYMTRTGFALEELDVMDSEKKVSRDKINSYGMLVIIADNDFYFVHRTFAEFFVAQYISQNIKNKNQGYVDYHARCKIIKLIWRIDELKVIKQFLTNFESLTNVNFTIIIENCSKAL